MDDAQWLDRVSSQTLAFVARRLFAERIFLVFAIRDPAGEHDLRGLPELEVTGLNQVDARTLLDSVTPGRLDERIRDRIVAEARGNPLALLELPRGLSATDLAGGLALPKGQSVLQQIEAGFMRRLESLSTPAQRLLLAAAADPVGDVSLLWRVADLLGIPTEAAAEAESAGIVEVGARVRFRHPLLRAAVYRTASPEDRRAVHGALAEATDQGIDPEGRAWHRAQACSGPDEHVARELEQSAELVYARGGIAAAAAFLERATQLTPDPGRRAVRALAAAEGKFKAGSSEAAYDLLTSAELGPIDDLVRARLWRLRAQVLFARGRAPEAETLLLEAANLLEALHDPAARDTYLEALGAAIFVGRLGRSRNLEDVAEAARTARPAPEPLAAMDLLLNGLMTRFTEGYVAAVPPLSRALGAFRSEAEQGQESIMRWLWLACPVAPEPIAPDLWDDDAWHDLAARALDLAREVGALAVLPKALSYRAAVHVHAGEFAEATELLAEADRIAGDTGSTRLNYTGLLLAAWRGDEAVATNLIERSAEVAASRGEGRALGLVSYVTAVLNNGLGRYQEALDGARRATEQDDLGFHGFGSGRAHRGCRPQQPPGPRDGCAWAARGAGQGGRNRLGAGDARPVDCVAQGRCRGGSRLPGRSRAARTGQDRDSSGTRPPGVRRVAAAREQSPRCPRPTTAGPRHVGAIRGHRLRRARPRRARRRRGPSAPAQPHNSRRPHRPRSADRTSGE